SYYEYEQGGTPFEDFAARLDRNQKVECRAIIDLLMKWGDSLEGEQCLTHACSQGELKEFQGDLVRVFYLCQSEALAIIIIDCLLRDENGVLFEAIRRKV
ncbi:MAG TPA: hypothetical protein VGB76_16000, partial [Pyrinomonadaceae bacterium]